MSSTGTPSFHPDVLSALTGPKRVEMLQLIHKFKSQQVQITEFLASAKLLLGPRLYGQLNVTLSQINAARARAVAASGGAMPPSAGQHESLASGIQALSEALSEKPAGVEPEYHDMGMASMPSAPTSMPSLTGEPDVGRAPSTLAGPPDVTRMDTDSLQDVLQYSGVDLREEAEAILREQEALLVGTTRVTGEDHRARIDSLFTADFLAWLVAQTATKYKLANAKHVDPGVYDALLLGLQVRLANLLDDVVLLSRHRADVAKGRFRARMENDTKRQLLLVEKIVREGRETARQHVESMAAEAAAGGDGAGAGAAAGASAAARSRGRPPGPSAANSPLASPLPGAAGGAGGPSGPSGPSVAPSTIPHAERDSHLVKTRITNATALTQLGMPIKSWMTSAGGGASAGTGPGGATGARSSSAAGAGDDEADEADETSKSGTARTSAPTSMLDKEARRKAHLRALTMQDLLAFMSMDRDLSHSPLYWRALIARRA